ncbi:MAG: hypothetical protein ACLPRE_13105, partial [Limisphaerales bacterium]
LTVREFSVPPGGEWKPRSPGWSLIQIEQGTGYFRIVTIPTTTCNISGPAFSDVNFQTPAF